MRKFLSLLLAMCMACSLCMMGASAAGSDDDIDNNQDVFNVRVPDGLDIYMDKSGRAGISGNPVIENLGDRDIEITGIRVAGESGWDVLDFDNDFSGMAVNEKKLAMAFRGDGTGESGEVVLSEGNWTVSGNSGLDLAVDVKMPVQDACEDTRIATVYWDFDWAGSDVPDGPGEDGALEVPVLPGEGGSASVDSVTTGDDRTISVFPDVTADEGYVFDHWENQDGETVDENTVFETGDEIKPVFKVDGGNMPAEPFMLSVVRGYYGVGNVDRVAVGEDGYAESWPEPVPDDGYMFDHWENQDGETVDETAVFVDGDSISPVCVCEFKCDGDVITGFSDAYLDMDQADRPYHVTTPVEIDGQVVHTIASHAFAVLYRDDGRDSDYATPYGITLSNGIGLENTAFWRADGLREVVITSDCTLNNGGFYMAMNLQSVCVEEGVTEIPVNTFNECMKITTLDLPDSLRTIGERAFANCIGMNPLVIPDGVTAIAYNAFNSGSAYLESGNGVRVEYHGNASGAPWRAGYLNGVEQTWWKS